MVTGERERPAWLGAARGGRQSGSFPNARSGSARRCAHTLRHRQQGAFRWVHFRPLPRLGWPTGCCGPCTLQRRNKGQQHSTGLRPPTPSPVWPSRPSQHPNTVRLLHAPLHTHRHHTELERALPRWGRLCRRSTAHRGGERTAATTAARGHAGARATPKARHEANAGCSKGTGLSSPPRATRSGWRHGLSRQLRRRHDR